MAAIVFNAFFISLLILLVFQNAGVFPHDKMQEIINNEAGKKPVNALMKDLGTVFQTFQ